MTKGSMLRPLLLFVGLLSVSSLSSTTRSDKAGEDTIKDKGAMRVVGHRPRVEMRTVNVMNRLMEPIPAPWPTQFSVLFVTNISLGSTEMDSDVAESKGKHDGVGGALYYAEGRGQRIWHSAGSRECFKFYNRNDGCNLVFTDLGMFFQSAGSASQQASGVDCCLDIPGLHAPPAKWTSATHKFKGTRRVRGRMCHAFRYGGGKEGGPVHVYWQDSVTRLPCAFSFHGEPLMTWYFNVTSLVEGPQDSSLFQVTSSCEKTSCAKGNSRMENHDPPSSGIAQTQQASSTGLEEEVTAK